MLSSDEIFVTDPETPLVTPIATRNKLPTFREFFREHQNPLTYAFARDCLDSGALRFERDPATGVPAAGLHLYRLKRLEEWQSYDFETFAGGILRDVQADAIAAVRLHVIIRVVGEGLRLFKPTLEECLALEEIEVRMPVTDYAQPFPLFFVEFPEAYRRLRALTSTNKDTIYPFGVHLLQSSDPSILATTAMCSFAGNRNCVDTVMSMMGVARGDAIEDVLAGNDETGERTEIVVWNSLAVRIAMNAMLLMMLNGFREVGKDADKSYVAKLLERIKKRKGNLASQEHNKAELRSIGTLYTFEQEINIRRQIGHVAGQAPGCPTGREMPPHWRRSHWRMTACGQGRTERRRVLIPHVMVNKKKLEGDALGDVRYK